ncbi:MAG: hypothetical protein OEY19_02730 [Gammaproteobacteria bacterium]|nr:hypothetical protein [Gammaproteobacteria bacterium]MDH5630093.1 hypothetical protein [Gammaproteobacteria bacterium]
MFELTTKTVSTSDLDETLNQKFWVLYSDYHNISYAEFTAQWKEHDKITYFVCNRIKQVVGFIGIRYYSFLCEELSDAQTLSFGQTFIHPKYRGKLLIQKTVIKLLLKYKLSHPFSSLFFYTDALSYKPFLLMAYNLSDYYPNPYENNPYYIDELFDQIGEKYFSSRYDPETKTTFRPYRLVKDETVDVTPNEMKNSFIKFYVSLNPGHKNGNGLLIMCPMTVKNVLYFMFRQISKRTTLLFNRLLAKPANNK